MASSAVASRSWLLDVAAAAAAAAAALLIVNLCAGLAAYPTWGPTLQLLSQAGAPPSIFTDFLSRLRDSFALGGVE